ncbi:PREDICTED: major facilitator superfamily domain-containing protein 1-like [Amphimedon queenslandica]|uniref:Lysosomal dipeptide transporter MFSD1 n=1 Tax=Amphimedon queenslandica TaxID=400682 RepID=A0A1X7VTP2_AMPQE|nr:PREDICTED: major facilitator superfamily domain-containing protein 1-like [Amphimedon queenslandica]|eukprot:XP_011403454.1 PREDICTED: major facilitator superfamily domain-containing protein 1-like [Amphimedon queenslandica]
MPSGLEDTIIKVMGVTTAEYDLLFSATAWPGIVLCLVGGIIIDKLVGLRLGLLIVVSSVLVGQTIWGVGGFIDNYFVMLVGRFFIGAGNDLTIIVANAFKAIWFKEKLPLAISIDIAYSRIGGTMAILIPQLIYDNLNSAFDSPNVRLGVSLLTAAGAMLLGLLFSLIVIFMDYEREKKSKGQGRQDGLKSIKIDDIKQFSFLFWLVVLINTTFIPVIHSFVTIGQLFFVQKYGFTIQLANIVNSLNFGLVIILAPVAGLLISKSSTNLIWMLGSALLGLSVHAIILLLRNRDYIVPFLAVSLYSIAYSFWAPSYMALPALLIKEDYITTAYGMISFSFNASLALMIYLTGLVVDNYGYFILESSYFLIVTGCIVLVLLVIIVDSSSRHPKLITQVLNCLLKIRS